jgi:hypothetical protein
MNREFSQFLSKSKTTSEKQSAHGIEEERQRELLILII